MTRPVIRMPAHDRTILLSSLAGIVALAWLLLVYMGSMANSMKDPMQPTWSESNFLLTFAMWAVMMVAMMLPSVSPTLFVFDAIMKSQNTARHVLLRTGIFVTGYLAVWFGFSALAVALQWIISSTLFLSEVTMSTSSVLAGAILLAAGIFQFTPLKHTCLTQCRSPQGFFMTEWREGNRGALVMGLKHGSYCLGCCWLLMSLLFVVGVMNMLWVAALAILILLEKAAPRGQWLSRLAGVVFSGAGAWIVLGRML